MKLILLGAIGMGMLGAPAVCQLCAPTVALAAGVTDRRDAAETRVVRLRIEGMTCGGCAISARIVLERLDGVEKADIDYEHALATVRYDDTRVTPEQMVDALKQKLNYAAVVVPEPPK